MHDKHRGGFSFDLARQCCGSGGCKVVTLENLGSKGKHIFTVVVVRKGHAKKSPGWLGRKMYCTNTPTRWRKL